MTSKIWDVMKRWNGETMCFYHEIKWCCKRLLYIEHHGHTTSQICPTIKENKFFTFRPLNRFRHWFRPWTELRGLGVMKCYLLGRNVLLQCCWNYYIKEFWNIFLCIFVCWSCLSFSVRFANWFEGNQQ